MGKGYWFFSTLEKLFSGTFKIINHQWSYYVCVIDKTFSVNVKTVSHKTKYYKSLIASFFQTGNEWTHLYGDTATKQSNVFLKEY